jgi:hypothetical protein
MISDLEEVLRRLLIRELPIKNGEVSIEFFQPRREWSARLSRPTLNIFLYDLHENNKLRQPEWEVERVNNRAVKQRRIPRIDLKYLITAWAKEPADEHRLLSRTLMTLFRFPEIPGDLLPESLQDQPVPIPVHVAEQDALPSAADMWGVLDNEIRPAIACTITLAINPYHAITGPLVHTRDLRFEQVAGPAEGRDRFWMVGGALRSGTPLVNPGILLVERGLSVPLDSEGKFVIGNLEAGEYTLEISSEGCAPARHKIIVPSEKYDVEL